MSSLPQKPQGVSTYSWEDGSTTYDVTQMDAGQRFRCAISQATEAARRRFPHSHDRIERAYTLVHEGKVVLHPQTRTATVQSSDGKTAYTVNGHCDCPDAPRAPEGMCKHKFAALILRRAVTLVAAWKTATGPVTVTPEATSLEAVEAVEEVTPSSTQRAAQAPDSEVVPATTRIPAEFLYERQGQTAILWGGLLHMAHEAGLCALQVDVVTVAPEFAVMRATATFNDGGVWTDIGDASPTNVGSRIAPHFIRMASTRAMARTLRLALDVPFVCACELDG